MFQQIFSAQRPRQVIAFVATVVAVGASLAQTPNAITTCTNNASVPGQIICNTQTIYQLASTVTVGNGFAIVQPSGSTNVAPVAVNDTASVAAGGSVLINVLANDSDPNSGDSITLTQVSTPNIGTAVIESGQIRYNAPASVTSGTATFTYTITDTGALPATATVTVTIGTSNRNPVANADTASVASGGSVTIAVTTNDTDPDGDTITLSTVNSSSTGTAVKSGNNIVFTAPTVTTATTATIAYTITDGRGGSATGTVTVNISAATPVSSCPSGEPRIAFNYADRRVDRTDGNISGNGVYIFKVTVSATDTSVGKTYPGRLSMVQDDVSGYSWRTVTLSQTCNDFSANAKTLVTDDGSPNVTLVTAGDPRANLPAYGVVTPGVWYINVRNQNCTSSSCNFAYSWTNLNF